MAKFRIRLKVQGLELEVDGEREDIPIITATVQRQLASIVEPAEVVAETPRLGSRTDQQEPNGSSGKNRTPRRRSGTPRASGDGTPIDFRHDSSKYGNPLQTWSIIQKTLWLLYALKSQANAKEVDPAQLVATFNQQFKSTGKLHPPLVTRELGKAKVSNPAPVGEDKGLWYLTDEGDRQAQALIQSLSDSQ